MTTTTTAPDARQADKAADTPPEAAASLTDALSPPQAPNPADDAQTLDGEGQGDNAAADDDAQALDDDEGQDDNADTFPRRVVEKLRREASGLRDRVKTAEERAQAAETTVTALQRQAADQRIKAAGVKPAAVWAVAELADVLATDGTVDDAKISAAMQAAKDTLGVPGRRRPPAPGAGGPLRSGAGVPQSKPRGFEAAFGPRPK